MALQPGWASLTKAAFAVSQRAVVPCRTLGSMTVSSPIHPPRAGKVGGPLVSAETVEQALARAKGYPYPRPQSSFIFVNGPSSGAAAYTFDNTSWVPPSQWSSSLEPLMGLQVSGPNGAAAASLGEVCAAAGVQPAALPAGSPLTAILAIGSNAAPEQLARKFPLDLFPQGVIVPVIQCVLRDFDVVYAPLVSSYGSATATLEASPGTDVSMFITYLTPQLQQRMHETEGAYNLVKLEGVALMEGLGLQDHLQGVLPVAMQQVVYQYNHQCGTLHLPFSNPGSSPVALAEISAANRTFPQLTQVQMQAALREALQGVTLEHMEAARDAGPPAELCMLRSAQDIACWYEGSAGPASSAADAALDDWILSNLHNHTLRRARVAALTNAARPFQYDKADVMLVIGTRMSTSVK